MAAKYVVIGRMAGFETQEFYANSSRAVASWEAHQQHNTQDKPRNRHQIVENLDCRKSSNWLYHEKRASGPSHSEPSFNRKRPIRQKVHAKNRHKKTQEPLDDWTMLG
jgi:hypothetical protein